MSKVSPLNYIVYVIVALVPFAAGLYVLIEKRMITGGSLATGGFQELEFPANVVISSSLFLFAALILFTLMEGKYKNKICEWTFFTALVLFIIRFDS